MKDKSLIVEMCNPQKVILEEIGMKETTRDDIALTYAFAIRQKREVGFGIINRAIIERWSRSALEYIKKRAWFIVQGK